MPAASVHAVTIPIPIPISSSSRSRTTLRKTASSAAAVASTSQSPPLPPLPASPPASSAFPTSTAASTSTSPPSYMASTSTATASTSFADINIRDFFPEGDNALLKFMDEASIIRAQREALIALNEAALERALRESQQTAAKEEESRKKGKSKQKQKEEQREEDVSVPVVSSSPSASSGTGVATDGSVGASTLDYLPVPIGGVTGEPEAQGTTSSSTGTSLSSQVPAVITEHPADMPSSPPAKRCSTDEAAARLLAREWRVASLQGALFANPDMMPSTPASSSISSSSSSTPPSSSSTSSPSSSSASAARKSTSPSSSTRAAPMTIPAEAFYPRTNNQHHHHHHHHQHHHHHRNNSSTSSPPKNSTPVQTGSVTPDHHKIKLSPPPPAPRVYTSASSAAAAQAAAKNNTSLYSEKSRVGTAAHSKTSSASTSQSGAGKVSQGTPAAGTTSPRKSVSPERAHTTTVATTATATTGSTSPPAAAATSIPSSEKRVIPILKAHILTSTSTSTASSTTSSASASTSTSRSSTPNTSPGISPSPSVAPSSSSSMQASPVMTSASKVAAAAEKEREREREKVRMAKRVSTSSASAAAAAAKRTLNANTTSAGPGLNVNVNANSNSSPARPLIVERDRDIIIPSTPTAAVTPPVLSALSSPLLKSTFTTIETTILSLPPKAAATSGTTTPPRDVDELFSLPAKKDVVPISSLLESDDEGDGGDSDDGDDEDEDDESEDESEDEDDTKSEVMASATLESIPFRDLYTANRSCSKCGESILSPRNTLPVPADSHLHVSCPKCATLHCRGCSTPATKCPKNCTGSKSCMIKECCPQIRAIAIFEALSTFDHDFLLEAGLSVGGSGGGGGRQREEYIQAMITRPLTAQSKKLEMTFVKCVDALTEVFKADSSPSISATSKGVVNISTNIATLFERSLMLEVIHAFLRNTTVRDWIAHCETYCSILELLRYMTEGAVGGRVMATGLRKIERSCGLKEWMWERGEVVWVEEGGDGSVTEQAREKMMVMYRGQLRGGAEKASSSLSGGSGGGDSKMIERDSGREESDKRGGTAAPLKSLMNELETHRGSLLEFLAKVSFTPTVMKLNALCDGISYLVLGQVLAGI